MTGHDVHAEALCGGASWFRSRWAGWESSFQSARLKSGVEIAGGLPTFRINGEEYYKEDIVMVSKILVPTDGSTTARKAVRYAVDLAKQLNASVVIVSVIDNRSFIAQTIPAVDSPLHVTEPIEDYLREAAKGYVGEIEKLCDESGVESKTVITKGHPVEGIVKVAQKSMVDLIVMSSHGRTGLAAAVLGSVAYGVIHNETKVPVLIVRKG